LWWFFFILVSSFFLPKAVKYRLYGLNRLYMSYYYLVKWLANQFFYTLNSLSGTSTSFLKTINYYFMCLTTGFQNSAEPVKNNLNLLSKDSKNFLTSEKTEGMLQNTVVGFVNSTTLLSCLVKGYSGVMFSNFGSNKSLSLSNERFFLLSEYMQVYSFNTNYSFNKANTFLNNVFVRVFYNNGKLLYNFFYILIVAFIACYALVVFLVVNAEFFDPRY
jgi:hypothetical protein